MFKKYTFILIIFVISGLLFPAKSFAVWIWTPETNKWINPKLAVKETPAEQLKYAMSFYEDGDADRAIKEFQKLLKHYPRAQEAPEAQYYIGLIHEERADYGKALDAYQLVIDKYPFSDLSTRVVEKQYDLGVQAMDGALKKSGFMEAVTGVNLNVVEIFETVIKNAPYSDIAPVAQYKIGLYYMEKQFYQEARDAFEKVLNDYPNSEWAKAARYQLALSDAKRSVNAGYDQAVTGIAVQEFKRFVEQYPDAELSDGAKNEIQKLREKEAENHFIIAEYYEKRKSYKAAKIYYQDIIDEYPATTVAPKALLKIQQLSQKEK